MFERSLRQLERHERRRARGIPTVSVLSDPVAERVLDAWLGRASPGWIEVTGAPIAKSWLEAVLARRDGSRAAIASFARWRGKNPSEAWGELVRRAPTERRMIVGACCDAAPDRAEAAVVRALLHAALARHDREGNDVDPLPLDEPVAIEEVVRALVAIDPELPALVIARRELAAELVALAEAAPRLRAIARLRTVDLDAIEGRHTSAVLREGVIASGSEPPPKEADEAHRSLGRARSENTVAAYDRARSAAERFLHQMLMKDPRTRGCFALNERVDVACGARSSIEIDLACVAHKVAVEVDGYHHFREPAAYRRDRQKDLALQTHGYVVVRVLADDVVEQLEAVLDAVVHALEFARTRQRSRGR